MKSKVGDKVQSLLTLERGQVAKVLTTSLTPLRKRRTAFYLVKWADGSTSEEPGSQLKKLKSVEGVRMKFYLKSSSSSRGFQDPVTSKVFEVDGWQASSLPFLKWLLMDPPKTDAELETRKRKFSDDDSVLQYLQDEGYSDIDGWEWEETEGPEFIVYESDEPFAVMGTDSARVKDKFTKMYHSTDDDWDESIESAIDQVLEASGVKTYNTVFIELGMMEANVTDLAVNANSPEEAKAAFLKWIEDVKEYEYDSWDDFAADETYGKFEADGTKTLGFDPETGKPVQDGVVVVTDEYTE